MKKAIIAGLLAASMLFLSACGSGCRKCGAERATEKCPICGSWVCEDCLYDGYWDLLDDLMYCEFLQDYLDARGYDMVKR